MYPRYTMSANGRDRAQPGRQPSWARPIPPPQPQPVQVPKPEPKPEDQKVSEEKKEQFSTISSVLDSAQPVRQPSWAMAVPPPGPPTQMPKSESKQEVKQDAEQEQKPAEDKGDKSSVSGAGGRTQPVKQPSSVTQIPETQSQLPKSESKQEVKDEPKQSQKDVTEAKKEESTASKEPALVSSDTDNQTIVLKDSAADEAANKIALQKGIRDDISNLTRRLAELHAQQMISKGDQKQPGQELGVGVITMAGENKGAVMDLGSELRKDGMVDIHRRYKVNQDNKTEEGLDAKSKGKPKPNGGPVNAFVNSNVQGANNSILYNSTCPHRDPGVHLALSNSPVKSLSGSVVPNGKDFRGRGGGGKQVESRF